MIVPYGRFVLHSPDLWGEDRFSYFAADERRFALINNRSEKINAVFSISGCDKSKIEINPWIPRYPPDEKRIPGFMVANPGSLMIVIDGGIKIMIKIMIMNNNTRWG